MSSLSLLVSPVRPPKIKHARRVSNGREEDIQLEPKLKTADERKAEVLAYLEAYPRSKASVVAQGMGIKSIAHVQKLLLACVAEGTAVMITAPKIETFYSLREE